MKFYCHIIKPKSKYCTCKGYMSIFNCQLASSEDYPGISLFLKDKKSNIGIKSACGMISYCSSYPTFLFFLQLVSITPKLSSRRILPNYLEKSSPPHSPSHLVVSALLSLEAMSVMKSSCRLRMLYQTGQQTRMVFSELVSEPA